MIKPSETSDILQQQLDNVDLKAEFEEIGTVLEVGDGVANVFGLDNVTSGELIEFENGVRGVAMNLEEDQVGVVLLNLGDRVKENFTAKRTGHIASIKVTADYVLKEQGLDSELECLPFETGDETTTYMLLRQDESGEKLKKIIDDSLKTLIENGTLKELSEKYLDGDYAPQL